MMRAFDIAMHKVQYVQANVLLTLDHSLQSGATGPNSACDRIDWNCTSSSRKLRPGQVSTSVVVID